MCIKFIYTTLAFIVLSNGITANAQITVHAGKLSIQQDSKLAIKSDFINKSATINNGAILLTGNWNNQGTYSSVQGSITLAGEEQQTFAHNNQAVDHLIINNETEVTIISDVYIHSELTLQKGIVMVKSNKKAVISEKASVQGGSSKAYIDGALYHTGSGDKFYPIGKNGQYTPIELNNIKGNNPIIGIEFFDQSHALDVMEYFYGEPFYWQLQTLSGSYEYADATVQVSAAKLTQPGNLLMAVADSSEDTIKSLASTANNRKDGWHLSTHRLPGSVSYLTLGVVRLPENFLYIPNAVSPLAPNAEDRTVKIYSKHIDSSDFQWTIWDAWGHVIYQTKSYEQASTIGWQKAQKTHPSGIYQYLLQARLTNGQMYSKSGNIILYD